MVTAAITNSKKSFESLVVGHFPHERTSFDSLAGGGRHSDNSAAGECNGCAL